MSTACSYEGCTFGETGKCALENDPNTCPHRTGTNADSAALNEHDAVAAGSAVLTRPNEPIAFPRSTALGLNAIEELMRSRYVTVVGILGEPESGKTACLVSLYLLLSNGRLEGWTYADSRSLMAFDESSRGARRWNDGNPPEQMTAHTEMADDRTPGFLHLRLLRQSDGRRFDLALPDLPGEWTKALMVSSRSDRLSFLKSADVIWIVVDGRTLVDKERRNGAIAKVGVLAGRLQTLLAGQQLPKVLLVTTHLDSAQVAPDLIDRIKAEAGRYSITLDVVQVAPFSESKELKPGSGIAQLIDATASGSRSAHSFWPVRKTRASGRAFLAYGSQL